MYILCLSVSDKRLNGWTNWAQNLCETLHNPREGLWTIKIEEKIPWNLFFEKTPIRIEKSVKFEND